jgi:hypothetical protein
MSSFFIHHLMVEVVLVDSLLMVEAAPAVHPLMAEAAPADRPLTVVQALVNS